MYEELESCNLYHPFPCRIISHKSFGATTVAGKYWRCKGSLWISKRGIQGQEKKEEKTTQSQETKTTCGVSEKKSVGKLMMIKGVWNGS